MMFCFSLAQAGNSADAAAKLLLPIAGAIIAVILLGSVWMFLRKRLFGNDEVDTRSIFEELDHLREQGELTDQEYQTARRAMVDRASREMDAQRVRRAQMLADQKRGRGGSDSKIRRP